MESILQGISGVIVYLLVTGISEEEHNQKVGGNTHKTREGWATLKEGQVSLQGAFSFTLKTQDQQSWYPPFSGQSTSSNESS